MKSLGSKATRDGHHDRRVFSLSTALAVGVVVALVLVVPHSFTFSRRYVTRFCYTSPNTQQILSQCVLCDYFAFPSTLLGCTGSTALTTNMTATQALCVINGCFGQVQQVPSFSGGGVPSVGKRKRDIGQDNIVNLANYDKEGDSPKSPNTKSTGQEVGSESSALEAVQIVKSVHVNLDLDYKDDNDEF